jgi:hypothetical protein
MKRCNPRITLLIVGFGLLPAFASADTVYFNELEITQPGFGLSFTNDTSISGVFDSSSNYTVSAEFCENDFCSGGAIPVSADTYLRFTNVTITCPITVDSCGSLTIDLLAYGATATSFTSSVTALVDLTVNGTTTDTNPSTAFSGTAAICFTSLDYICTPNALGTTSFSTNLGISGGSLYSYGGNPSGTPTLAPGFNVDEQLTINSLDGGTQINLPGSFDTGIALGLLGSTQLPEPSTVSMGLVGFALLGVAAFRKRSKK